MINALNVALYSVLGGTATAAGTAVYYLAAPDEQPYPFVVWDYVSDMDDNACANRSKNEVVFIRAYASTPGAASAIDEQIDALLHLNTLSVSGYANFWMARELGYSLEETDQSGRRSYMAGAEYRIKLDAI